MRLSQLNRQQIKGASAMGKSFEQLTSIYPAIQTAVTAWDGITTEAHRFGGVEFKLGKVEIGHIHRNGMVDIPFTRKIREALVTSGAAQEHHLLANSGWISFYIRHDTDVQHAIALFRLSYLHKRHNRTKADFSAEIDALPFVDAVLEVAFKAPGHNKSQDK